MDSPLAERNQRNNAAINNQVAGHLIQHQGGTQQYIFPSSPIQQPATILPANELLQHISTYYQENYQNIPRLLYEDQNYPISDCYINLVLLTEEANKEKERGKKSSGDAANNFHDKRLASWEQIYAKKQHLALKDLFNWQETEKKTAPAKGPPSRLLLLGRAGIGKSTLCQYLAYQWTQQHTDKVKSELPWLAKKRNTRRTFG